MKTYANTTPVRLVSNDDRPKVLFHYRIYTTSGDGTVTKTDLDISPVAYTPFAWFRERADSAGIFGAVMTKVSGGTLGKAQMTFPEKALDGLSDGDYEFEMCLAYATGAGVSITGATAASPCVITSSAHGLLDDDEVLIESVGGMTQLNNRVCIVTKVDADKFSLDNTDSTKFVAYTSGGTFKKLTDVQSAPDLIWARVREDVK
jgi:hypothetical protein